MTIIFATNNEHKFKEIKAILPSDIDLLSLADAGISDDIPETGDTLEENAMIKARTISKLTGFTAFADDTGLEIQSLGGAPGVMSARFAGDEKDMDKNIEKVISLLDGKSNRRARFRTVIAFVRGDEEHSFEGIAEGTIITEKRGNSGFGYDPVFLPDNSDLTFAEMKPEQKYAISHRSAAFRKLADFLSDYAGTQ
jgi:XTP/dITP diphosphohydrolase